MFMTGVLCTVCGAQVYLMLDLRAIIFYSYIIILKSLILKM